MSALVFQFRYCQGVIYFDDEIPDNLGMSDGPEISCCR